MDIAPDKQNIDRVFSNTAYYIDFYQRDYRWTDEPVLRLLDDIFFKFKEEYARSSELDPAKETITARYPWYYLNTYVTNVVEGRVYVVDGQQRLTTLSLILIKLRHLAKAHTSKLGGWIDTKIAGQSGFEQEFWMNHIGHRPAQQALFDGVDTTSINTDSGITAQNMIKNYITISTVLDMELKDKRCFETFVFYFLHRLVLINLAVEQTDVSMVFEVINDRGVRLRPYEILKGKHIALVYHDSPFGKEAIPILQERAAMHGFKLSLLPVTHPGVEQKSTWLQIRQSRPDYVVNWGWGVMNSTLLKEAQATGYPREKIYGVWWAGAEPDVKDVGMGAKGYNAITMQHGTEKGSAIVKEVLDKLHAKGQGTGPKDEVGEVLYMRGLFSAMFAVEGVRQAQEKYGKGKVMTGEQARWGYENLNLTQPKLDALGFKGVLRPISTSCADHMGANWARIHTWNGTKWEFSSDWYQADEQIIKPMVKAAADKYAAEKKLTRRTPADCQS